MMHIRISNYQLKDLDAITILSQTLACYFPKPAQFVTAIHELILNAVEHGNLGIGFEAKTELIRRGKWKAEIARRLTLPEYGRRQVEIELTHDANESRLTIADQGKGFPWRDYAGRELSHRQPCGRGLWIVFNSKFDRIMFNPAGNEVTCLARHSQWKASGDLDFSPAAMPAL